MAGDGIAFIQINLHHCRGASTVLVRRMAMVHTGFCLIQEPWVVAGNVKGLGGVGRIFRDPRCIKPRACILVKGLEATLIATQCSGDLTAVKVNLPTEGGATREVVVASGYFPFDSSEEPPPIEVQSLVDYCQSRRLPLLLGCDANAHHTVWGSSDINSRGDALLQYLVTTDLCILNKGTEPTFYNSVRREVIDLTLCTVGIENWVGSWRVSKEPSLFDHNHILFEWKKGGGGNNAFRNPRRTNWGNYKESLRNELQTFKPDLCSTDALDYWAEELSRIIVVSFQRNCISTRAKGTKRTQWWTRELEELRREARRTFNRARNTCRPEDWQTHKNAKRRYKNQINAARTKGWRSYCEGIEEYPEAARLLRILAKNPEVWLEAIRGPTGEFATTEEECLRLLLEANFPDFRAGNSENDNIINVNHGQTRPGVKSGASGHLASRMVTQEKVRWAVNSFQPYKAPGTDGVYPVLLQEGLEELIGPLVRIFRASIALSYVPRVWKTAKVVFIPKPGKASYTSVKDFRPISLTSFVFKALEKLVDRYVQDNILATAPLHSNQHAYRAGYSTETALHSAVYRIEEQLERGELAVGAFIDIEGAFNCTSIETVCSEAIKLSIPEPLVRWLGNMLSRRTIVTRLGSTTIQGEVSRGCAQGGVISPTIWCLVANGLLEALNVGGCYAQAYADDFLILTKGSCIGATMDAMQLALKKVEKWCGSTGLTVNPGKTELVIFTRKYKIRPYRTPRLMGRSLEVKDSAKYLGVVLDRKLTWEMHLKAQCNKFLAAFWTCRRAFSSTWGLNPKIILWLYRAILVPRLVYGALVWWPRAEQVGAGRTLERLRGLVLRGATGAIRTTPTVVLGVLLGIEPLHLTIMGAAATAAHRLEAQSNWKWGTRHTRLPTELGLLEEMTMRCDMMTPRHFFGRRFNIEIPSRLDWDAKKDSLPGGGDIWYTDGSKTGGKAGSGYYCRRDGKGTFLSLGGYATVFQSEICAIMGCVQRLIELSARGRNVTICSDSQAALRALAAHRTTSRLVWECKELLNELTDGNRVRLLWVPGHTGIRGNEIADRLAALGAKATFIGPEPSLGIARCLVKGAVREWVVRRHTREWTDTAKGKHAKAMVGQDINTDWTRCIQGSSRKDSKLLTQIITGHLRLRYHELRKGKEVTGTCRWCDETDETPIHLLTTCPRFAELRHRHLGDFLLTRKEIETTCSRAILTFWRRAGLPE